MVKAYTVTKLKMGLMQQNLRKKLKIVKILQEKKSTF